MKKRLILDTLALLVLALALWGCLCLTGCAQTRGAPQDAADAHDGVTTLRIASVGMDWEIDELIARFNAQSEDIKVEKLDYSQNGTVSSEAALSRLNTEIVSGKYPDMIAFRSLIDAGSSPYAYISKGLLADMEGFMATDADISPEKLAIYKPLKNMGGVFVLSDTFIYVSKAGDQAVFGERYGWTLDEYLALEAQLPVESAMIYNVTRESLLEMISARYLRVAVDWDNAACDFDNADFIKILELTKGMREYVETAETVKYAFVDTIASGSFFTALIHARTPRSLAEQEAQEGVKISCIGTPTVDGSCGSDVAIMNPVGILAQGAAPEKCWEFVKFMLMQADIEKLPVYLPRLEEAFRTAIENKVELPELPADATQFQRHVAEVTHVNITEADEARFMKLLGMVENIEIYDQNILGIIKKESAPFFAGEKTAAEVASLVQSKVSLYLQEQKN